MTAPATKLHVVAPDDIRAPEDMLGFLFAREAQLAAELAAVQRDLDVQRIRYSDAHRLVVRAGLDTLRRLFGPCAESVGGMAAPQGTRP